MDDLSEKMKSGLLNLCARIRQVMAVVLSVALLAGCPPVQFVEDYDPEVYDGLADYYEKVDSFMTRMGQLASQDGGKFSNPGVQEYYAESLAQLNTLLLRVEANDDDERCLPAKFLAQGIGVLVENSLDVFEDYRDIDVLRPHIDNLEALQIEDELGEKGSCTTIVVTVVRDNHVLLETIHRDEEALSPTIVSFTRPLIAQGVRIALTNEAAKKRD